MKTIGKLSINPEKMIKNEELVNLRGGFGEDLCVVNCYAGSTFIGSVSSPYYCPWDSCPPNYTGSTCNCDPFG